MSFIRQLFIWWVNATPGTLLTTWYSGRKIGEDEFGNSYYESKDSKRRWMIFAGTVEASRVPPDWHGWLHHTFDRPPTEEPLKRRSWELDHQPNLSGTAQAYRPEGSLWKDSKRPAATGDYESWRPN